MIESSSHYRRSKKVGERKDIVGRYPALDRKEPFHSGKRLHSSTTQTGRDSSKRKSKNRSDMFKAVGENQGGASFQVMANFHGFVGKNGEAEWRRENSVLFSRTHDPGGKAEN